MDKRLDRIRRYRLIDNSFMKVFFKDNPEAVELALQIILGRTDIKVLSSSVEYNLDNMEGRSVILDVHAEDESGIEFDVEIQRRSQGAGPERAGYHLSLMHTHMLTKNESFDKLNDAYVIFITETDCLGNGKPISVFETMDIDDHKQFKDKRHIIYVNGAARCGTTEIGRLMEDFFCTDPDKINYPQLRERFRYLKDSNKGVNEMMTIEEEVMLEGAENATIEIALKLIRQNRITYKEIADVTGLSLEKVTELAEAEAKAG